MLNFGFKRAHRQIEEPPGVQAMQMVKNPCELWFRRWPICPHRFHIVLSKITAFHRFHYEVGGVFKIQIALDEFPAKHRFKPRLFRRHFNDDDDVGRCDDRQIASVYSGHFRMHIMTTKIRHTVRSITQNGCGEKKEGKRHCKGIKRTYPSRK